MYSEGIKTEISSLYACSGPPAARHTLGRLEFSPRKCSACSHMRQFHTAVAAARRRLHRPSAVPTRGSPAGEPGDGDAAGTAAAVQRMEQALQLAPRRLRGTSADDAFHDCLALSKCCHAAKLQLILPLKCLDYSS